MDCYIRENNEYYTEYFETKEDVLEWVRDKFPNAKVNIRTALHKIEEAVEQCMPESDDGYFTLHQFSYE